MEDAKQIILQQAEVDDKDALRQAEVQFQKSPNVQNKCTYGVSLIQTNDPGNQEKGVTILQDLSENQSKDISREALYWTAFGLFRLKNYPEALTWNGRLLAISPSNQQAQALNEVILEAKEGGGTRRPLKRNKSLRSIKKATSAVANSAKQAVNMVKTKAGLDKEPKKEVVKGDGGKVKFGDKGGSVTPTPVASAKSRELPKLPSRPEPKDPVVAESGSLTAREKKGTPTYEMTIHSAREPNPSKAVTSSPGPTPSPGNPTSMAKVNDIADTEVKESGGAATGGGMSHGKSVGELLKGGFNPLAGRPGGMARPPPGGGGGGASSGGASGGAVASGAEYNLGQRPVMLMPGMATGGPPKMSSATDELPKENLVTDEDTGITFSAAPRLQNVKKAGPPKGRRPPGNVKTRAEDTIDPSFPPAGTTEVSAGSSGSTLGGSTGFSAGGTLGGSAGVSAGGSAGVSAGGSVGFSAGGSPGGVAASAPVGRKTIAGPSRRPPQQRSPTMPSTTRRKVSSPEKPQLEIEAEVEVDIEPEIAEKTTEKLSNRPMGRSIGTPIKVPLSNKSSDTSSSPGGGSPSWMTAKSTTPLEGSPSAASNLMKVHHIEKPKPVITRSKTETRDDGTTSPLRTGGADGWDRTIDVRPGKNDTDDTDDTDPEEEMADDNGGTDEVEEDDPSPPGAGEELEFSPEAVEEMIPCTLCKRNFPESVMKILLQKKFCQPCVTRILKAQQDRKIKQQQQSLPQQQSPQQHSPPIQPQQSTQSPQLQQQRQPIQAQQRARLNSGGRSGPASPMTRNPRPITTKGSNDFQQGQGNYSAGNDEDYNLQVDFGISSPITPSNTQATSHLSVEDEADELMGDFRRGFYKPGY